MTKRLILNADDFGLTKGVDDGIIRAHRDGILTSATLMANGDAFDHAVELALANPTLGVGCHLVLVGGKCVAPAEDVPTLADADGYLAKSLGEFIARVSMYKVRRSHLEIELRAQIEKIIGAGISPTHFDTHKHTHAHPQVLDALGRVAREFGITRVRKPIEKLRDTWSRLAPSRQRLAASAARATGRKFVALCEKYGLRYPDHFLGLASTGSLSPAALRGLIRTLADGQTEIMLHPGVCDADLAQTGSRLQGERELEMQALLDPAVKEAVSARGIELISYRELA
ncbi:MAG TPA: ChbG/HpnK family deacetylase [Candidatus Aquilonibacter sp.]|nr:ChbG/HpnK family deacetylase [Candidatus Aquilonibacter sp.]